MIGRRRLLTLTAAGVIGCRDGGRFGRADRHAFAPRTRCAGCRRAARIEVLDDYPYWVAQEVRLFRRHRDDARAGPVRCDRRREARRPEPGRYRLSLARRVLARAGAGHPLVSVFQMGGADVFDFAFRKGEAPADIKGLEGKTIVLGSAGWQSIADPMLKAAGVDITKVKYVDAGWPTWGNRCDAGPGRRRALLGGAARPVEGPGARLRLHPRQQLLEASGQQLRHPQGGFRRRGEEGPLCPLSAGLGGGPRVRPPQSARRDADRHGAVPRPRLADDPAGRD